MNEEVNKFLICECNSFDHLLNIYYDKSENDPSMTNVYLSVHLKNLKWYKRLWHAIKYIFGFKSSYGDFDEFLFKPKDYKVLKDAAEYLENSYKDQFN